MSTENVSRETEEPEATESAPEATDTEQPAVELTDENDSESDENGSGELGKVRREAARYRTQLRDTEAELETLRTELFRAKVAATGRLADPEDMPVNPELLADGEGLEAAIGELLEAKPHLKARSFGNIGLGEKKRADSVSLGSILRSNA